jgi:glycosyltransferase involved in cell wall biosynthesis
VNVAFYAPLKPPDHPTPSGDRAMARLLLRALAGAGHRVTLASRLRSFERAGDARAQSTIRRRAGGVLERLRAQYRAAPAASRPQLWFTYHLYHKAPDLLGPVLSRELAIPYVVAEASHAPKQAGGPWDEGYRATAAALRVARRVIVLNPADDACVRALLGGGARLRALAPFIDAHASVRRAGDARASRVLHRGAGIVPGVALLVAIAMMRPGAKLASYRLLGDALARITDRAWQLLVLGDGPARAQVHASLAGLGERVRYAGQCSAADLPRWLAPADLYVWPAVDEAWGMAFLEAAALGIPAVAGRAGGVGSVVAHGRSGLLVPPRDAGAFAAAVAALLDDAAARRAMGEAARRKVLAEHDLPAAAVALDRILGEAIACANCC